MPQASTSAMPFSGRSGAERQQLTVLFCDLVDSTKLSTRLDLEDLRDVIGEYHRVCAHEVTRFGGFVVQYLGDGLLAYFGYPAAHEDDAERAVHSGLALVDAVRNLASRFGLGLHVRVGIATGTVVVGDLAGEGMVQQHAVTGETPNLAARLQAVARPNAVAVSDVTRRLAGRLFEYRGLGPVTLKGFDAGVPVWQVLGASGVRSRFEAQRAAGLTPLVGREAEMQHLRDRWDRVVHGHGQLTVLVGEAGIGKSRLARGFEEDVAGEAVCLHYACSPLYPDRALFPIISQIEHAADFRRDDPVEQKLEKLEALLGGVPTAPETIGLFADLLSLPAGDRYGPLEPNPPRRREKTLEALLARLEALAAHQPVLLVFEDLHWIDPTSLELLTRLAQRLSQLRVFVLATARPDPASPWLDWKAATTIPLTRLSLDDAGTLVGHVIGGKTLPRAVFDQILTRSDGVPLFVEELTKTVLESGALREEQGRYTVSESLPALAIPETLQDTLRARLDRHPGAREVAQIGAVIGREFSLDVLAPVAGMAPERLRGALDELVQSGLLSLRSESARPVYAFKHVLVRDAGYSALLRDRRRDLHARVAATLERLPDVVEQQPDLLARHLTDAGLADRAIPYWSRAGRRSLERSAAVEAVAQLRQGLALLRALPEGPERRREELDLRIALGRALILTRGFASPEVEETFARGYELCTQQGDAPELLLALAGLRSYYLLRGNLELAFKLGDQFAAIADPQQDPILDILVQSNAAITLYFAGDIVASREHDERAIELYTPAAHPKMVAIYGFDSGVSAHIFSAQALWYLGYPDRAVQRMRQSYDLVRKLPHPPSLANVFDFDAWLHVYRREPAVVRERAEADLALSGELGIEFFSAHATLFKGWALVHLGRAEEGLQQMQEGLEALRATGVEIERAHFLSLLAQAQATAGRAADGLRAIDEALTEVDRHGGRFYHPEMYRLKGELLLMQAAEDAESRRRTPDEAERCFRMAIRLAQGQQAKSLELRAATSLARLWQRQGRSEAAHEVLAPVYGWFTEGFETPDLQEARELLGRLVVTAHD